MNIMSLNSLEDECVIPALLEVKISFVAAGIHLCFIIHWSLE